MWENVTEGLTNDTGYSTTTQRMSVPSGWLVRTIARDTAHEGYPAIAVAFLPDEAHTWKLG